MTQPETEAERKARVEELLKDAPWRQPPAIAPKTSMRFSMTRGMYLDMDHFLQREDVKAKIGKLLKFSHELAAQEKSARG